MKTFKALATSPVIAALLFLIGCVVLAQGPSLAQVWIWSQTPGNNATADASINWATGMSPSSVSPSARTMMSRVAQVRDDWSGANPTIGTSTAYTVTSNQGFDSLAHLNKQQICFTPNATNGVNPTLSVDGLTAEPIDSSPSTPIGAGVLILGTPYCAVFNNSDGAFYLRSFYGSPFNVPLGTVLDYTGSSAPNSNFVLTFGQCISRTTYSAYFSLVSTTFGACDGTTTFGVPDLRGMVIAGIDNMGGSAANRVTSAGSGIAGTTLGASGGAQNQAIAQGNLPAIAPTFTGTQQTASTNEIVAVYPNPTQVNAGGGSGAVAFSGIIRENATTTFTPSGTISNLGSGNALTTMPPTTMLSRIVRIF